MMQTDGIPICASADLHDGGSIRFHVSVGGEDASGFVIRHNGAIYAYLNRCTHLSLELDQGGGSFFDSTGYFLMCARHGAIYTPDKGRCAGGPCSGGSLRIIQVEEINDQIIWYPDEYLRPARA